jgi:AraC-like DNA-binding protein
MASEPTIMAWRPEVEGVAEVLHASFMDHAYPMHTHDAWTLLVVDRGAVRYELHRHGRVAARPLVTLLPPHVPHDGRTFTGEGLRKRVVYLEPDVLGTDLVGRAVGRPCFEDDLLRTRIDGLHRALTVPGDEFEAASRLGPIEERLRLHLTGAAAAPRPVSDGSLARNLRDLLDARFCEGLTLREASDVLHSHPTHLVRSFSQAFGLPPHLYLNGRRIDQARRLLLDGKRPVDVAPEVGFYDQAHFNRHFKKMLGVSPAKFVHRRSRDLAGRSPTD